MTTRMRVIVLSVVVAGAAGVAGGLVLGQRLDAYRPSMSPQPAAAVEPVSTTPRAAEAAAAQAAIGAGLPDLSTIAERALRVSASISSTTTVQLDPFFQFFYGNRAQQSQSSGSGVVVTADGYILTNTHVIGQADRGSIRVTLEDGRERAARLIATDPVSDLAVVKIDAKSLETIPWGDSSKLRVAEWVLAVGNPFQFTGTVTLGIVSTVMRSGDQVGSYQDFIQTDAAINPGNSGGALINARGELVGINTMIYSQSGGNQGIGFAIPSNAARQIMTALIRDGVVSYGSIGYVEFFTVTSALAERYGREPGVLVRGIERDSPAYRAGLRPGDTVVSINAQPVANREQIDRVVIRQAVGSRVAMEVVREDGRRATLEITVAARQAQSPRVR